MGGRIRIPIQYCHSIEIKKKKNAVGMESCELNVIVMKMHFKFLAGMKLKKIGIQMAGNLRFVRIIF